MVGAGTGSHEGGWLGEIIYPLGRYGTVASVVLPEPKNSDQIPSSVHEQTWGIPEESQISSRVNIHSRCLWFRLDLLIAQRPDPGGKASPTS